MSLAVEIASGQGKGDQILDDGISPQKPGR
jgi:hypothetical protein